MVKSMLYLTKEKHYMAPYQRIPTTKKMQCGPGPLIKSGFVSL